MAEQKLIYLVRVVNLFLDEPQGAPITKASKQDMQKGNLNFPMGDSPSFGLLISLGQK